MYHCERTAPIMCFHPEQQIQRDNVHLSLQCDNTNEGAIDSRQTAMSSAACLRRTLGVVWIQKRTRIEMCFYAEKSGLAAFGLASCRPVGHTVLCRPTFLRSIHASEADIK